MARLKPKTRAIEHTLTWDYPQSGQHLAVEMRQMDAREWYDSAESHDPTWQVVENLTAGCVVALRPRLT
jgi:hypothetical protein